MPETALDAETTRVNQPDSHLYIYWACTEVKLLDYYIILCATCYGKFFALLSQAEFQSWLHLCISSCMAMIFPFSQKFFSNDIH